MREEGRDSGHLWNEPFLKFGVQRQIALMLSLVPYKKACKEPILIRSYGLVQSIF